MKIILPDNTHIKPLGRAAFMNEKLWLCYSATGAAFRFEGKELTILLQGDDRAETAGMSNDLARVKAYVDGICAADRMVDAKEVQLHLINDQEKNVHCVEIVKVSESAMSTVMVKAICTDDDAFVYPQEEKAHLIEFAGDSITCGYGVDDEVAEHNFKTSTEDATKGYACLTAKALDADYSLVSLSGYGIISGYSGDGIRRPDQLLPNYYEKTGFSYGSMNGAYPQDTAWQFEGRKPDAVVINLGTNDQSFTRGIEELCEEYCTAYQQFIRTVRSRNADAHIFCMLGVMGEALCPMVQKAVETYQQETGDSKISFHWFTEQKHEDGIAADWHPSQLTHRKTAEKLSAIIKNTMKW